MECWVSDIFGNQYGVFKETLSSDSLLTKSAAPGELWVRTNNDKVLPASVALSSIISFFDSVSTSDIYYNLNDKGIINVDCLYDTLMFQMTGHYVFAKINYDYNLGTIVGSFDDIRTIDLTDNQIFGQTWMISEKRKALISVVGLMSNKITFTLYEVQTNPLSIKNIFTLNNVAELSAVSAETISNCLLSYNSDISNVLASIIGKTTEDKLFVVDLLFKLISDTCELTDVTIYNSAEFKKLPELSAQSNTFYSVSGTEIDIQLSVLNEPTTFELVNHVEQLTLTNSGRLSGDLNSTGLYFVNYIATNEAGSSTFGITLSCC
jgi:hypothetical protein